MGIVTDIFLPLAIAFIMLSLGLGLTHKDFLRIVKKPKDFFIGVFSQMIILPVVALLLIITWPFELLPALAVGVMIIASAPGGATSNILTSFAKGDVALSISLTAIISLISFLTIPLVFFFSLNLLNLNYSSLSSEFSLFDIARSMFLIVTVPVILGMTFRKFFPIGTTSFEPIAKKISIGLFVVVLIGAIISERDNIIAYFSQAGLITLVLNVLMMVIAFYIAKFFGSGEEQKKCITIECGLQNGTLAIVVATTIFGGGPYLIPAATYSLIMFGTSLIYLYLIKKGTI